MRGDHVGKCIGIGGLKLFDFFIINDLSGNGKLFGQGLQDLVARGIALLGFLLGWKLQLGE